MHYDTVWLYMFLLWIYGVKIVAVFSWLDSTDTISLLLLAMLTYMLSALTLFVG